MDAVLKSGDTGLRSRLRLWAVIIGCLTLVQIAATLLVPRSFSLTLINDVIDLLLMFSVLCVFLVNVKASPRQTHLFWTLLAACWGIRVVGQAMWMYFDLVLRKEAPNPFAGDILLCLSNIPVLAALLLQPHLEPVEGRTSKRVVDFLLLLLWWLYLYVFFVIPWQYVSLDEIRYGQNYNRLDGLLDVVLLLTLGFLWSHSMGRWKWFYASFFAAQFFITASSHLANQAIDEHLYYPGSWYDLPYAVAVTGFAVVGMVGLTLARTVNASRKPRADLHVTRLGMLAVLSLPVIGGWAVLYRNVPLPVMEFRELVTLGTMLVMAFLVFVKLYQLRAELAETNQILQHASLTDPLTGARNRRFFDATISGDASQVLRSYAASLKFPGNDLIFYMVDLDDFKEVNDRYGHDVGDKVLVEVTRRINSAIRASDILIRWGGDEFLIVSRYSSRAEAESFALRILTLVGDPTADSASAAVEVRMTCSVGWAAFPWYQDLPDVVPMEAVLGLADRGLYEAKTCGKNQAIGVSPSDKGTDFLVATASGKASNYSVQTHGVEGPPQSSPSADFRPPIPQSQLVGVGPADC